MVHPACRNVSDCTEELQGALDSCTSLVVLSPLPNGRVWITQPLFVRNCPQPQTLELKPTVVLEAIKNGFHGNGDDLLEISNVTGFTLHGPGATLRMHRSDCEYRNFAAPARQFDPNPARALNIYVHALAPALQLPPHASHPSLTLRGMLLLFLPQTTTRAGIATRRDGWRLRCVE